MDYEDETKLKPYYRKINYYETDQMHVVHHSNYARFLEEARLYMMNEAGINYEKLENLGIIIPVLELHDYYIEALHYDDEIEIDTYIKKVTAVRFTVEYKIYRMPEKKLVHKASTAHAFLDNEFKPMNLKKNFPEVFQKMKELIIHTDGDRDDK